MSDVKDRVQERERAEDDQFNRKIALAVAIISAFLAISKIKSDNIVQAIQKTQAELTDSWNQYQAKRLRQFQLDIEIARTRAMIRDGSMRDSPENATLLAGWNGEVARYKGELKELLDKGNAGQTRFENLNQLDDLFDFSEAFLTLGLAMMAVAALIRTRWLLLAASAIGAVGIGFGFAGFLEFTAFRPGWLSSLLGI